MRIAPFLIVYGLQIVFTLPTFLNTCAHQTADAWAIYLIHHALDVFLFWSPVFLNRRAEYIIHILTAIITGIHWSFYGNKCFITVALNRRCGYDEEQWLESLKNYFGLRQRSEYFQFMWLGVHVIYDIYALLR